MNSIKFIRIVYLVTCCRVPIIIGLMHLYVHFDELMGDAIKQYLLKEFMVLSQWQPLWYTWGMTSFMMGIGFVIIGLLHSISFMGLVKREPPSIALLLTGLLYYLGVLYSGILFKQSFQLYGGFICVNLLLYSVVFMVMKNKASASTT